MTDIVLISPPYKTKTKDGEPVLVTHCYPKKQIWIGMIVRGNPSIWGLFGNYNNEDTVSQGTTGNDLMAVPEDVEGMTPPYEPKAMDVCEDEDGEPVLLLKPVELYGGRGWRVLLNKDMAKVEYMRTNRLAKNLKPWPKGKRYEFGEILEGAQAYREALKT